MTFRVPTISLPVLTKELRARMRGVRTPWLLLVASGMPILVGVLILASYGEIVAANRGMMAEVGRRLLAGVVIFSAVLGAVLTPALCAGAFTAERERQSLDALLLTRLSSRSLVLGKLLSALGLVLLCLLGALPVLATVFYYGGVDWLELLGTQAVILSTVLLLGTFGLYCSLHFRTTAVATVVAYVAPICWIGLPIMLTCQAQKSNYDNQQGAMASFELIGLFSLILFFTSRRFSRWILAHTQQRWYRLTDVILCVGSGIATVIMPWVLTYLLYMKDFSGHLAWSLLANPFIALWELLTHGECPLYDEPAGWFVMAIGPACVVLQFLGAWVFFALSVRQLERLRRPQ